MRINITGDLGPISCGANLHSLKQVYKRDCDISTGKNARKLEVNYFYDYIKGGINHIVMSPPVGSNYPETIVKVLDDGSFYITIESYQFKIEANVNKGFHKKKDPPELKFSNVRLDRKGENACWECDSITVSNKTGIDICDPTVTMDEADRFTQRAVKTLIAHAAIIIGPINIPKKPKRLIPPNIPNNIKIGCKPTCSPNKTGLRRFSLPLINIIL